MLKKLALTLFGLVFAAALIAPPKATAQVHIGVGIGGPSYGYVVHQRPYYDYYGDSYVVYAPNRAYGYRDGYYDRDYRRYDDRGYRGHEYRENRDYGHRNWENRGHGQGNWENHDHGNHDRWDHGHGER